MAEKKETTVKQEIKNKETAKKNTTEISSKESSDSASQAVQSSTDAASTAVQSESTASKRENYVLGESQKPVTMAYRNNWKRIFNNAPK